MTLTKLDRCPDCGLHALLSYGRVAFGHLESCARVGRTVKRDDRVALYDQVARVRRAERLRSRDQEMSGGRAASTAGHRDRPLSERSR